MVKILNAILMLSECFEMALYLHTTPYLSKETLITIFSEIKTVIRE